MVPGSQPAPPRLMPRCLAVPQNNRVAEMPWVPSSVDRAGPALGAHPHGGTDPRNSQRARRVALACEVVSEDHITRSKTARGAIADPDFHLPHENKNVLSPGRGVPIAPMVRRETTEHEVGTRLKRNVVALLGRQREVFKMGLAVVARIYPYDHAGTPSHGEIIVHASLSEDEGEVSASIGTWAHDKVHQSGAPRIDSQGSRRLGSPSPCRTTTCRPKWLGPSLRYRTLSRARS